MGLFQHLFTERKERTRLSLKITSQELRIMLMLNVQSLKQFRSFSRYLYLSPICLMFKHTPYWEAKLAKICLTLSSWCALAKSTGVKPLAFLALNSALAERSCSTRVTWPEKNPALWGTPWDTENPTVFGASLQTSILLFNASTYSV